MNTTNSQLPPDVQARIADKQQQKDRRSGLNLSRWGWVFCIVAFSVLQTIIASSAWRMGGIGTALLFGAVYLLSALIFPRKK